MVFVSKMYSAQNFILQCLDKLSYDNGKDSCCKLNGISHVRRHSILGITFDFELVHMIS